MAGSAEIDSTAFKQLYQLVPFAANKEITARDNYAQHCNRRAVFAAAGRVGDPANARAI